MHDRLTFTSSRASATVDLGYGGRLSSFIVDGSELLVGHVPDPLNWGCYPMVPFAGRLGHGTFMVDGIEHQLPRTMGDHAIHGYGFTSEWNQLDDRTIVWPFSEPWPFSGRVEQRVELTDTALMMHMTITAGERQPVGMGWHPWFRRTTAAGDLRLQFEPGRMYERGPDGLPTGSLITPPPGPWDDCFTELRSDPVLSWGSLQLTLSSSVDHWIVYDQPEHALCVEPQTGPPNDANTNPTMLEAGEQATMSFTIAWDTVA
jgi:galactose mutarotase-like enzyme